MPRLFTAVEVALAAYDAALADVGWHENDRVGLEALDGTGGDVLFDLLELLAARVNTVVWGSVEGPVVVGGQKEWRAEETAARVAALAALRPGLHPSPPCKG
jgi:hypothetical protein